MKTQFKQAFLKKQIETRPQSGNVYWQSNARRRCIGKIAGDTFHCERIPEKHLHRKSQAYGFNYELMKNGSFKWVVVHLPSGESLITFREYILRKGFFLEFRNQGFEKQIFLKVSDFGLDNVQKNEPAPPPKINQLCMSF